MTNQTLNDSVSWSLSEAMRNSFGSSPVFNLTNLVIEASQSKHLSKVVLHSGESDEFMAKKKAEFKLKLNKIRERTKLLLDKHNWRKYFNEEIKTTEATKAKSESQVEPFKSDQSFHSFSIYNISNTTILTDSSSLLSTVDLAKDMQHHHHRGVTSRNQNQADKQTSELDESKQNLFDMVTCLEDVEPVEEAKAKNSRIAKSMPTSISNLSIRSYSKKKDMKLNIIATPVSTSTTKRQLAKKKMTTDENNSNNDTIFYDNDTSLITFSTCKFKADNNVNKQLKAAFHSEKRQQNSNVNVKRKDGSILVSLTRQPQSLTFIADFASTSTPNRKSPQPITSTPKQSTHDPIKYHPTRTIRNKHKKINIAQQQQQQQQQNRIISQGPDSKPKKPSICSSDLNINLLKYKQSTNPIRLVRQLNKLNNYNNKQANNKDTNSCNCQRLARRLEPLFDRQHHHQSKKHAYNFRATTTTSNVKEAQSIQIKKRKLSAHSSTSSELSSSSSCSSINTCEERSCQFCFKNSSNKKVMSAKITNKIRVSNKISSTRISSINFASNDNMNNKKRFKPATIELEISLQDLLYKPAKLRNLANSVNSVRAVKSAAAVTANLNQPVAVASAISNNNAALPNGGAFSSKVYYL